MKLVLALTLGLTALVAGILLQRRGQRRLGWVAFGTAPVIFGAAVAIGLHGASVPAEETAATTTSQADPWGGVGLAPGAGSGVSAPAASTGEGEPGSIEEVTSRLAARLEREPNDAGGWVLLAQSYEYLGRKDEAAKARAKAQALGAKPGATLTPEAVAAHAQAGVQLGVSGASAPSGWKGRSAGASPVTANDWWARGVEQRRKRDFKAAAESFRQATMASPKSADAWADYADALAAANEGDLRKGSSALDRALKLDPRHIKALWLRASLQLQERDYAAAARTWQTVLALVPSKSNDARIIRANLDEARALAGEKT